MCVCSQSVSCAASQFLQQLLPSRAASTHRQTDQMIQSSVSCAYIIDKCFLSNTGITLTTFRIQRSFFEVVLQRSMYGEFSYVHNVCPFRLYITVGWCTLGLFIYLGAHARVVFLCLFVCLSALADLVSAYTCNLFVKKRKVMA